MTQGCCDFPGDEEGWLESVCWILHPASIFSACCSQPSPGLLLIHAHLQFRLPTVSHPLASLNPFSPPKQADIPILPAFSIAPNYSDFFPRW